MGADSVITPYYFQDEAIKATFDYFYSGKRGNPLICLPTGTGKSVVIALFIERVLKTWPGQRIMMLTHVKELINQNAKRMIEAWPLAPLGIYSAGLKQRDTAQPIIFGGIKSIYKRIEQFGHVDVLVIDEAHLLGPKDDSMYQVAIAGLKKTNPRLVVIGLTATGFRIGQGLLTDEGSLFTDVVYDLTNLEGFNRLVAEGYLAPIRPKKMQTEYDVSNVGMVEGDFNKSDLQKATNQDKLTRRILTELCHEASEREHWMIFASGVEHSDRTAELLNREFGVKAVSLHSKIGTEERNKRVAMFESGEVRCIVNNNVLTTGYDFKPIDCIAHLRPTMSAGLWVQMNGRGTRPSRETGKIDCLALDFAGNTRRLGPINDPFRPKKPGKGGGDAPVRVCPKCSTYLAASARICYVCGHEFQFDIALFKTASTEELIRSDQAIINDFAVTRVIYRKHIGKDSGRPCLQVNYITKGGIRSFTEWWHLDAVGRAGHEAREKWRLRSAMEPPRPNACAPFPSATEAALSVTSSFRTPRMIRVWVNRPHPEIQSVEF